MMRKNILKHPLRESRAVYKLNQPTNVICWIFVCIGSVNNVPLDELDTSQQCRVIFSAFHCNGLVSNITVFPKLPTNSSFEDLLIINTNLQSLQNGSVFIPSFPRLISLALFNNSIRTMNTSIGASIQTLKKLMLQRNKLSTVPKYILKDLVNLEYLDLSSNEISTIESFTFSHNKLLQLLKLENNEISKFGHFAFFELLNLRYLHLSYNAVNKFPFDEAMYNLPKLEGFHINGNNLTDLRNISGNFTSCRLLSLKCNRFQYLGHFELSLFQQIESLYLDRNRLTEISATVFGGRQNALSTLRLKGNLFETIPVSLLPQLPSLKTLDLSENRITEVPQRAFVANVYLLVINLRANYIKFIHPSSLAGLQNLKTLDLAYNQLSKFPSKTLEIEQDFFLELDGNPWICDCDMSFLQEWFRTSWFFSKDVSCVTSNNTMGSLLTFPFDEICDMNETSTMWFDVTTETSSNSQDIWSSLSDFVRRNGSLIASVVSFLIICVFLFLVGCIIGRKSDT